MRNCADRGYIMCDFAQKMDKYLPNEKIEEPKINYFNRPPPLEKLQQQRPKKLNLIMPENSKRNSVDMSYSIIGKKRQRPNENENENKELQPNKKLRVIQNEQSLSIEKVQDKEEMKELVNENNVWKKSRKIRKEYFCKNYPTLVITPIHGILLQSQTAVLKLFGKNTRRIALKLKAHSFSSTRKTIYLHFQNNVKNEELQELAVIYNDLQQSQLPESKNENENENENEENRQPRRISKCVLYNTNYVQEQKAKRNEIIHNPEINRVVLLKNVSLRETEQEIKETLQEMNYNVENVERFTGLPVVKVTLSTAEDVKQLLQEKEFLIGYNLISYNL